MPFISLSTENTYLTGKGSNELTNWVNSSEQLHRAYVSFRITIYASCFAFAQRDVGIAKCASVRSLRLAVTSPSLYLEVISLSAIQSATSFSNITRILPGKFTYSSVKGRSNRIDWKINRIKINTRHHVLLISTSTHHAPVAVILERHTLT